MGISNRPIRPLVAIPDSPEECWNWIGAVFPKTGYGKKQQNGKTLLAHRWMWETLLGPIPKGLVINHKCSNRRCVNPTHLELTDQAGNCRHGKGAKLTQKQVLEIKAAKPEKGWGTALALAGKFQVSSALIHDIWNGRAWRDV